MRTREKVLIAVIVGALILGGVIVYSLQSNEVEANYTRWLLARNLSQFFTSPKSFVFGEAESGENAGPLFYGAVGVFGLVVMMFVMRMFRDGETVALKAKLHALAEEKQEAEKLLQEEVWKGKTARQAKDSVTRDLEESIERMEAMIAELTEKEHALKLRDDELRAMKSGSAVSPIVINGGTSDQALRAELVRVAEALQGKDADVKELRQRLSAKSRVWENELQSKEDLLKRRDLELDVARTAAGDLAAQLKEAEAAHRRAEELLQKELQNKKEVLQASDTASRTVEKRLQETVRALEAQAGERDKQLKRRDGEVAALAKRMEDLNSAKEQAESLLDGVRAELDRERQGRERLTKDLEARLGTKVSALQSQLDEKDMLAQVRDGELNSVKSELQALTTRYAEAKAARERAEEALNVELSKGERSAGANTAVIRELEERYGKSLRQLQLQLREKEDFLKVRDGEIQSLTAALQSQKQKFDAALAASADDERALKEELRKEQELHQSRELVYQELKGRYAGELQNLQNQLTEREGALQSRAAEVAALQGQVASLTEQLGKVGSAKERAASLLQEKLRKEKAFLSASDSALRELEANFSEKIGSLERQLGERQQLIASRDADLSGLRGELIAAKQQASELAAAKQQAEKLLHEAAKEKAELLKRKDGTVQELQTSLLAKQQALETQLGEKTQLLKDRELELAAVKGQLAELDAANDQTAQLFQADAKEKAELLRARELELKAVEKRSAERLRDLEGRLAEKQGIIEARVGEVESLRGKLKELAARVDSIGDTREASLRELDDQLRQRDEALQAKDSALRQLDSQLKAQVRALEARLGEQQNLMATREAEVDALMEKVRELSENYGSLASEKERGDRALQEELREKSALLQARESSVGEIEERFTSKIEYLGVQLAEKHKLLESGSNEIAALREQMAELHDKLAETEAEKSKMERLLEQARLRGPQLPAVIRSNDGEDGVNGDGSGLDTLLTEREELLKARDHLIQNLMTELKEKKTQLARHEIEVWQGIERRDLWKQRLSKVGIRLKD